MSRLSSPRASASDDPATATVATPAVSIASPRPYQRLSPRPAPSTADAISSASSSEMAAVSAVVPVTAPANTTDAIGLTLQLPLPPASPNLPAIDFPLYSSTALFAPHGSSPSSMSTAATLTTAPPRPRPFFRSSLDSAARRRPGDSGSSTHRAAAVGATAAGSDSSRLIRSYRRSLPSPSLVDSLLASAWPHPPTAHTAQSRSTYLSMLPPDERQSVEEALAQQMAESAQLLLGVLRHLDELCSRPYDLSLHRIQPNQWQLPAHSNAQLGRLVAPLLSSVGLLRDGEQWIVGEGGVERTRRKVRQARAELQSLAARADDEVEVAEAADDAEQKQLLQHSDERQAGSNCDGGVDEEEQEAEQSATMPAPLTRHKSIHSTPMTVRPMPNLPTTARHDRSTFKAHGPRSGATQYQPTASELAAAAVDSSHSNRYEEESSQPKPLAIDVAGDRRSHAVALPRSFLSTASHTGAASSESVLFTVQPAALELGPLLVGCTYTTSVLLTNTSANYARYELLQPHASHVAPASSSSSPPLSSACRVHFAFRRGGLAAGLSKPLTAVIRCEAAGPFESHFDVEGEGGTARVSVSAVGMEDAKRWRHERTQRDRLNGGELGLTAATALPGSLKAVQSRYGRVVELSKTETEESKEQLLLQHDFSTAVLSKWRNKPSRT